MLGESSQPETAIALFVKTPGLSPLKTRLAATIGTAQALRLYRLCLRCVDQAVDRACAQNGRLRPYYAVAEPAAIDHPRWRRRARVGQGEGDLGQRLAHVHETLAQRHNQVMVVGVDLPWLSWTHLLAAVAALREHEMVLGPGLDGGYYLFASRVPIPETAYTQVAYSQPDTRAQFERLLSPLGSLAPLAQLGDLDLQDDIPALLAAAPRYRTRLQRRLQRALSAHER